ncbi:hypothetical protein AA106556_0792 [Neokomagataea tanensis NBRC 106556]|uniref:Transposase n=1 Tax=Neokomagataea tanensis NBRC 106556 TaxID=1223519 RepID=A0ABQ0QI40_9PROT|nr:hypothetical protein AA106556_0792 [Neokomagataea tanensis NBRC 106556]
MVLWRSMECLTPEVGEAVTVTLTWKCWVCSYREADETTPDEPQVWPVQSSYSRRRSAAYEETCF